MKMSARIRTHILFLLFLIISVIIAGILVSTTKNSIILITIDCEWKLYAILTVIALSVL